MDPLHIDLETRSAVELPRVGAHRYAEDPTTRIILGSYRFGSGPVKRWVGENVPAEVFVHVANGGPVTGHNQQFERVIWNARVAVGGNAVMQPEQQDCTMARALAMGLPPSLDNLGDALNITMKKDKAGHTLMMRMCRPATREPLTWHEKPEEIEKLAAYCDRDVEAETQVDAHLPALSERERRVWTLDQHINDRGFRVDLPRAQTAYGAVLEAKKLADREMWRVTNGAVSTINQVGKLVAWLNSRGIPTTSVADAELDELICGAELLDDDDAKSAVQIRRAGAGAFKFEAMLRVVCSDGRIRGSVQYHGTHGGRWAGRVVQPHNFKRQDSDEDVAAAALAIELMGRYPEPAEFLSALGLYHEAPLATLTLCARPMIIAEPGMTLYDADFSNIEGRLNAWFAGETWKTDAFMAYDRGEGPDLYKVTAGRVLGKPVEDIAREERQNQGKVPELACGYQGGYRAFLKMAAKYGSTIPIGRASQIVTDWRAANPRIVDSWEALGRAAIEAVDNPGCMISVLDGKVRYLKPVDQDFLFCCLPSGRVISYAAPRVGWSRKAFDAAGRLVPPDELSEMTPAERNQVDEVNTFGLSYRGSKNGRFLRLDLYGGAQCAHVVSGTARDLLVEAMFAAERERFPLILTVHDELLAETRGRSAKEFEQIILASKPAWARGLPLVAKADEGDRYVK